MKFHIARPECSGGAAKPLFDTDLYCGVQLDGRIDAGHELILARKKITMQTPFFWCDKLRE
jgi:hypothetical protein